MLMNGNVGLRLNSYGWKILGNSAHIMLIFSQGHFLTFKLPIYMR